MHMQRYAFLLCCGLLAACGGDKTGADRAEGEDGLPKPAATTGSVTGMPDPGVAGRRPAARPTEAAEAVALPEPVAAGDLPPTDSPLLPQPTDGAPLPEPLATPPEDPNAPPAAPPAQTEGRVPADAQR